eukprot:TRINITY_DN1197_c0_g1_i2.p1 TRINITY_DN1197_c0_g1~~TRINITY_DN1197_c0_g1_i2.p1  ORF type:complete len:187 (+),score=25.65 TRINITY_DN1197_c0_g1_i2:344-904(+)
MGNAFFKYFFRRTYCTCCRSTRVLTLGLDNAGKSTILYYLKLGEPVKTTPTIGFNVESITFGSGWSIDLWDVGGQDKIRPLWRHYFQNSSAVVFVIDTNDLERIKEAKEELHKLFEEELLKEALFLIFANKQDLPSAMKLDKLIETLELEKFPSHKKFVQSCSALKGTGIDDGFSWLNKTLNAKHN